MVHILLFKSCGHNLFITRVNFKKRPVENSMFQFIHGCQLSKWISFPPTDTPPQEKEREISIMLLRILPHILYQNRILKPNFTSPINAWNAKSVTGHIPLCVMLFLQKYTQFH